jgi:hypothetical protein
MELLSLNRRGKRAVAAPPAGTGCDGRLLLQQSRDSHSHHTVHAAELRGRTPAERQVQPLQQRSRGRRGVRRSDGWCSCRGGEGLDGGCTALDAGGKAEVLVAGGAGVGVHGGGQQADEHHTRCFGVICSGASALKLKLMACEGQQQQQQREEEEEEEEERKRGGVLCNTTDCSHAVPF